MDEISYCVTRHVKIDMTFIFMRFTMTLLLISCPAGLPAGSQRAGSGSARKKSAQRYAKHDTLHDV